MSSTQLQNRSFHTVERTRTSAKCPNIKTSCAKCGKLLFLTPLSDNGGIQKIRARFGSLVTKEQFFIMISLRFSTPGVDGDEQENVFGCLWSVLQSVIL